MVVGACKFKVLIEFSESLKDKRMVVKSIKDKVKAVLGVQISEVDENDNHKIAVLGYALCSNSHTYVDALIQKTNNFIIEKCDAEVIRIESENFML